MTNLKLVLYALKAHPELHMSVVFQIVRPCQAGISQSFDTADMKARVIEWHSWDVSAINFRAL